MPDQAPPPSSFMGIALRLIVFVAAVVVLNHYVREIIAEVETDFWMRHEQYAMALLVLSVVLYVVLMALPFMPGIEVGVMLMVMMGSTGAIIVYIATVLSLTLSYTVGRLMRPRHLAAFLDVLRLGRAASFMRELDPMAPDQRLRCLTEQAPARIVPFLTRHRYLTVAVALNIPGNALIGGGGGIGMIAGMSRLYRFPAYFLAVALAVAPVPIAVVTGFAMR